MKLTKRPISPETHLKVIGTAIEILRMHGSIAGNRICQDWSGEDSSNPKHIFSAQERDDLEYNHQIHNSKLDDYEQGRDFFCDEMSVSFTMADSLEDLLKQLKKES